MLRCWIGLTRQGDDGQQQKDKEGQKEQMQWQRQGQGRQRRPRRQAGKSTSRHNVRQDELDWSDYPSQSMMLALGSDDKLDGPDFVSEKELGSDPARLDLCVKSCRLQDD